MATISVRETGEPRELSINPTKTPSTELNSNDELPTKTVFPVYKAKYSGVDVYELAHSTGSVMKRKSDNWVNATHILKAAKFAKAKRTRILEKDVIGREHEKIQGGFGKYQGTWVPMHVAVELALKYNIYDELKNLLEYVLKEGEAEPELAPKHTHAVKKDSKNNSLKEPSLAKKKKSVTEKNKKEKTGNSTTSATTTTNTTTTNNNNNNNSNNNSSRDYKKILPKVTSINNNNTGLRAFLPDEPYLSNSNLLALTNKRSFSEIDEGESRGGSNPSRHRKPVKLQRTGINKNSLMVAEPHNSSPALQSPISNHNMLPYLSSSAGTHNGITSSQLPLPATRTSSMKLPSLVAAANVALSPSYSSGNGIKLKPSFHQQNYSPSQSQNYGHLTRPASRVGSFTNANTITNGVMIKSTNEDSNNINNSNNVHNLLPSLSALSSQKKNLTYSPPVFAKTYLSNTPSFLETPKITNSGINNNKINTANYRQTPLKLDDGLSSDIEPMTPFFNSKQGMHQRQKSTDFSIKQSNNNNIISNSNSKSVARYENSLVQELIQSILSNEQIDQERIRNSSNYTQFRSFKVINSPIDTMGNTLLHLACGTGSVKIIELLLKDCEVNPFQTNKRGESCIMQSVIFKNCQEQNCLAEILDLFGNERVRQIARIRDENGENLIHLTLRFCERFSNGRDYLEVLFTKLDVDLLQNLLVEQNLTNSDTPLHLCQGWNDLSNFQLIIENFKKKYDNNFHLYNGFLNNYLYTIKNKKGITCKEEFEDFVEQHVDKEENAYYLKSFAKINCEIIPKVQSQLMDLLNKRQQEYCLNNSRIKLAQRELTDLNDELVKLNKLNNEIDEMKFLFELNNLHNEICSKRLESMFEGNMEVNKSHGIVNEDDIKIGKLKELQKIINEKTYLGKQLYNENNSLNDDNKMIDNCKKLISKYMEVDIENINEELIESMIKDLEKE